jgi:hypothetical protein
MPEPSKRDQLVEATKELLWEVGYEAMSPRDVGGHRVALALWILFVFRTDAITLVHVHEFRRTGATILIVVAVVVLCCRIRPCLGSHCDMYHAAHRRFWTPKSPRIPTSPSRRRRERAATPPRHGTAAGGDLV